MSTIALNNPGLSPRTLADGNDYLSIVPKHVSVTGVLNPMVDIVFTDYDGNEIKVMLLPRLALTIRDALAEASA